MATTLAISIIAISLLLNLIVRLGIWRLRREQHREAPVPSPGVTILKPLRGADPGLTENLRCFFQLDYPKYELLFGVQDADDPAVAVVRELMLEYPEVSARLVASSKMACPNPKVANLANLIPHASHELLLISDSNVRVGPGYLSDMVARMEGDVRVVVNAIAARNEAGIGGALERLQLNTFNAGAMSAANLLLGTPIAVGKSQMLSRSHLEAIGGAAGIGQFLAEDQIIAVKTRQLGFRTVQAAHVPDNVLGKLALKDFLSREARWASLRFRLTGPLYLLEVLFHTVAVALIAALLVPTTAVLAIAGAAVLLKMLLDETGDAGLIPPATPGLTAKRFGLSILWVTPLHDLLMAGLWVSGIFRNRVAWRGRQYRIGRGTRLIGRTGSSQLPAATTMVIASECSRTRPALHPAANEVPDFAAVLRDAAQERSKQVSLQPTMATGVSR